MITKAAISHFAYFFHIQINFSPVFYTVISVVSINQLRRAINFEAAVKESFFEGKHQQY